MKLAYVAVENIYMLYSKHRFMVHNSLVLISNVVFHSNALINNIHMFHFNKKELIYAYILVMEILHVLFSIWFQGLMMNFSRYAFLK